METEKSSGDAKKIEIQDLKSRISELLININDKSPYTIQEYIENSPDNILAKGRTYTIDVLISTISEEYEIKYLIISLDKRIKLEQSDIIKQNSYYILENVYPRERNGRYEFIFKTKNDDRLKSVGKCQFKFTCNEITDINMVIEIMGKIPAIDKKKTVSLKVVS